MRYFIILILSIIFCSCKETNSNTEIAEMDSPKSLLPIDYIKYFENPKNGLNITTIEGLNEYQLQFKTAEYMIAKSEEKLELSKKFVEKEKKEFGDVTYFTLKIKTNSGEQDILKEGVKNSDEFGGRVAYFSFFMQQDLLMVKDKDTIPCSVFHFERTYGIAPYCTLLLGFENKGKKNNSLQILYLDRLFSNKILSFNMLEESFKKIPRLITK
ncbi:MAG: hypothetical protein ACK48V_00855 [Crocinitomicaceae bacterium]|jgi:hypothetical protein